MIMKIMKHAPAATQVNSDPQENCPLVVRECWGHSVLLRSKVNHCSGIDCSDFSLVLAFPNLQFGICCGPGLRLGSLRMLSKAADDDLGSSRVAKMEGLILLMSRYRALEVRAVSSTEAHAKA